MMEDTLQPIPPSVMVSAASAELDLALTPDPFEHLNEDELRARLRECLSLLQDREYDLRTAAEVGQQLLEAHSHLREAYEAYITRNPERPKLNATLTKSNSTPEFLTNSNENFIVSTESIQNYGPGNQSVQFAKPEFPKPDINSWTASEENVHGSSPLGSLPSLKKRYRSERDMWKTSMEYLSGPSVMRSVEYLAGLKSQFSSSIPLAAKRGSKDRDAFLKSGSSMGSVGLETSEYVSTLERTNLEYQTQVASLTAELKESKQAQVREMERNARHLEEVRSELARVTEQVETLAEDKRRLTREIRENKKEQLSTELEDQEAITQLAKKLRDTEERSEKLAQEKHTLERQAESTAQEMLQLRDQLASFDTMLRESRLQREACERQEDHIQELQEQLEEARNQYVTNVSSFEAQLKTANSNPTLLSHGSLHDLLLDAEIQEANHVPLGNAKNRRLKPKSRSHHSSRLSNEVTNDTDDSQDIHSRISSTESSTQTETDAPPAQIDASSQVDETLGSVVAAQTPQGSGSLLFSLLWGFVRRFWGGRQPPDRIYERQSLWNYAVGGSMLGCI
ncbi:uncharacterized protein EV422DRAFT_43759 [Fimicolochytrium jonesii]|uniref:uncharacterized protein n=1 Tax=Fimicolochytrium jonesii TaxID=1396493 RepID=UPI0022FE26FF|nr:uncharacterized protein EV422DRAFT_43759 [Fimicolochytrium jonesii]KAI8821468.1 hypothetical protein EV422DRAFT_43759 [Fimicolochytrium jonesii]